MKVQSKIDASGRRWQLWLHGVFLPLGLVGFGVYRLLVDGFDRETVAFAGVMIGAGLVWGSFVFLLMRMTKGSEASIEVDLDAQTATFRHMFVPREWFRVRPEPEFTISFEEVRYAYYAPGYRGAPGGLQLRTDRGTVGIPETMTEYHYLASIFQTLGEPDRRPWWTHPWKVLVVVIIASILMVPLTWILLDFWLDPLLAK